jgi:hypothetical protein
MSSITRPVTYRHKKFAPDAEPEADGEEAPLIIIRRLFPRIASAIELMWGDRELDGYLNKLILADREDRAGFPAPVLLALLKLNNQHVRQFKFAGSEDVWTVEDRMNRVKKEKGPANPGDWRLI